MCVKYVHHMGIILKPQETFNNKYKKGHLPVCPTKVWIRSPVTADHTFNVLSSDPLTIRTPSNSKQVTTWSSWPRKYLAGLSGCDLQFISNLWQYKKDCLYGFFSPSVFISIGKESSIEQKTSYSRHFSLHNLKYKYNYYYINNNKIQQEKFSAKKFIEFKSDNICQIS